MKKQKAIIIDLEGTLSDHSHRAKYIRNKDYNKYNSLFSDDPVNTDFISKLPLDKNIKIIMVTAKSETYESVVCNWLNKNHIDWIDEIFYRAEGDISSSVIMKKLYLEALKERFEIIHAYDDRDDICQMYAANFIPFTKINCCSSDSSVSENLRRSAQIFEERDRLYGSSYKQFGSVVKAFFPNGLHLDTEDEMKRYGVLNMIFSKLNRYCNNFKTGGHGDSLDDLQTYSAMLRELDDEL